MHRYEIRLSKPEGRPVIHAGRYLGDFHAIRRAHVLAREGDDVAVWRGAACIYRARRGRASEAPDRLVRIQSQEQARTAMLR